MAPLAAEFRPGPEYFSGDNETPGGVSLTVGIAGIAVRFTGLSSELAAYCAERYERFLSTDEPAHEVVVTAGAASYLNPAASGDLRLIEYRHPEGLILLSTDLAGFRPSARERGCLRVSTPNDSVVTHRAMENYLRWTFARLAMIHGGLLLHASAVVESGRALVFFGPSGAGKSTIAGLAGERPILSDDLILLMPNDGAYRAYTTPFWGLMPQQDKATGGYPIAGFFRLRKGLRIEIQDVTRARAVGWLLACCPFIADPERWLGDVADRVGEIVGRHPVRELTFPIDPAVWDRLAVCGL